MLIAEIGCNHRGSRLTAKRMIATAANHCNVDAVKFQKRCNKELLTEEQYNAPHPNWFHAYGDTYGEHREALELSIEDHRSLKQYCEIHGVIYSSSVWDLTSAQEIASLEPEFIKIPSAQNLNFEVLEYLCKHYKGELHVSVGMTKGSEIDEILGRVDDCNRLNDLVLYACTSGYPVAFEDVCLLEMERLREFHDRIAFSGHHLGIAVDIAAMALGAENIERHFTLDRTWKGTDHSASLEPDGMRKLQRDLVNVEKALRYKETEVLPVEQVQRDKLKFTSKD